MNENQSLAVVEPTRQLARVNPMDALALMSEQEFEQRLESLKVAQHRMERIQRTLMREGVDFGVIPGTGDKPTLLKPGTETLCKFHHLVPTFEAETILGDGVVRPHIRVLTTCSLHYESEDGPIVAQGMGAANSWEKKYRWREGQRKCPQCGAAAIIKGKEEFGGGFLCWAKKGGCGAKFTANDAAITEQQTGAVENPDPFDIENTIRKMAAKRAQTDATLRATATSGLFSQDLEDMADLPAEGSKQRPASKPAPPARPKPEPAAKPTIPVNNKVVEGKDVPPFPSTTEFLKWCNKTWNLQPPDVWNETKTFCNIASAGDITSLDQLTWLAERMVNLRKGPPADEATDGLFEEVGDPRD